MSHTNILVHHAMRVQPMHQYVPHQYIGASRYASTACVSICPAPIYWESPLRSNRKLERLLLASVPHLGLPWPHSDGIPEFLVLQHTKYPEVGKPGNKARILHSVNTLKVIRVVGPKYPEVGKPGNKAWILHSVTRVHKNGRLE